MIKDRRIAKVIARAGLCSRREAEVMIRQRRVRINSQLALSVACNVSSHDEITVDGEVLKRIDEVRLWMFYKPPAVITSNYDPQKRTTIFDILPKTLPRVITIGRLDYNSEGLLLLTNSGDLARKMELPSTQLERRYRCRVHGKITEDMIKKLADGITIDGIRYGNIIVKVEKSVASNSWVTVTLHEGKNREIRKTFEYFDLQVSRLIRTSFHNLKLSNLKPKEVLEVGTDRVDRILRELDLSHQI